MKKLGYYGEKLIQHYEDCELESYQDGGGVWTIGWGNTRFENGRKVKEGDVIPQWRADELFSNVAKNISGQVAHAVEGIDITQCQFDALVSFTWNVGLEAFLDSTLLKVILNNPHNYKEIDRQFSRWILDNGKKVKGLVNRRKSESLLYRKGELKFFNV